MNKSDKLLEQKRYQDAKDFALESLNRNPENKEMKISLCRAYIMLEEYELVLETANSMLVTDVNDKDAYFFLGMSRKYLLNYNKAKENFIMAMRNGYDSNLVWRNLARLANVEDNFDEELKYLDKLTTHYPEELYARAEKVRLFRQNFMFNKALKELDEIIFYDPSNEGSYEVKSNILYVFDNKMGLDFAKESLKLFPENQELKNIEIKHILEKNEYKEALRVIDECLVHNDNLRLSIMKAEALLGLDKANEAMPYLEKVFSKDEGFMKYQAGYFLMILENGNADYNKVYQYADELVATGHNNPYLYTALFMRPYVLEKLGDKTAANEYEKLIKYFTEDYKDDKSRIILYLVMSYLALDMIKEAEDAIERSDIENGDIGELNIARYYVASKKKDSNNALKYKNAAIKSFPGAKDLLELMEA